MQQCLFQTRYLLCLLFIAPRSTDRQTDRQTGRTNNTSCITIVVLIGGICLPLCLDLYTYLASTVQALRYICQLDKQPAYLIVFSVKKESFYYIKCVIYCVIIHRRRCLSMTTSISTHSKNDKYFPIKIAFYLNEISFINETGLLPFS